jgi:general secretion pathway protein H
MALTDVKEGLVRPRISPIGRVERKSDEGFTLIELLCVMALIAILTATAMPALPRGTSQPRLESLAVATAGLLKADRNAALRDQVQIATAIDAPARTIRAGATKRTVRIPSDVDVDAITAILCHQSENRGPSIQFLPSGMSCGGVIELTRGGRGFEIRVNWLTGGINIVPVNKS